MFFRDRTILPIPGTMIEQILQLFGVISVFLIISKSSLFIHLYFLRTTKIDRFLQPNRESWALVTGASDGIGWALTKALLDRGFNIILHARNPEKLSRRTRELKAQYPNRQCIGIAADAVDVLPSVARLVSIAKEVQASGGSLTVLVNNVGGAGIFGTPTYSPLADTPLEVAVKQIELNATFPTILTRALLPVLMSNKTALVLNISSYAGVYGDPFISVYAATKAFNNIFSTSLAYEMRVLHPSLEVLGIILGGVRTPGNPDEKLGFASLAPGEAAENILARVGCGKGVCAASWRQCVLGESAKWMPEAFARWALTQEIMKRMAWEAGRKVA